MACSSAGLSGAFRLDSNAYDRRLTSAGSCSAGECAPRTGSASSSAGPSTCAGATSASASASASSPARPAATRAGPSTSTGTAPRTPGTARSGLAAASTTRAFGGQDQLEKLLRVVQQVADFAGTAHHLGGQLSRDLYSGYGRILRNIADLVDADAGVSRQRRLELFRE